MKRFLAGALLGLFLGWITVPVVKATYSVSQSDGVFHSIDDEDLKSTHAYKWYLIQILISMKEMNTHLINVEANTLAVKKKLNA
jgi:hypothetical protein